MTIVQDIFSPLREKFYKKSKSSQPIPIAQKKEDLSKLPSSDLVFVDGFYEPSLSKSFDQIICLPLDKAIKTYGLFLHNRFAKIDKIEKDPQVFLNFAFHGKGLFIYVPPHVQIEKPIEILYLSTTKDLISPRIHMMLGKNASISILQSHQTWIEDPEINIGFDLIQDAGSRFYLCDVQFVPEESCSNTSIRVTLKKDAVCDLFHATDGAKKVRFSAHADLLEENSSFSLKALAMLHGKRVSEFDTLAEHAAEHCQSHQHVKSLLNHQSRFQFDGKIYVHPQAQKTQSYQLNNTLLLSDDAMAKVKPNLEIFADDVKASHGATLAQMAEKELFYLCSRGIPKTDAQTLLIHGFCQDFIREIKIDSVKEILLHAMKKALHA